ncbi:uncharacterized protein K460DRAFT_38539 [Cucurbitaria berberidis CBS 394.84]|uniref:Uncharacterized protein n=1 Tax=Cucurbitaria berberidis CBS 394.84 TaxID=1168544 RepID=A0A9P4GU85_9PLEO|nr:uncharacterized protein K460DRAFT_38539 [Cucurbitaria berberidis CBS 394.84]KAF1851609.1 hypothetical protein K460DRAFT_38539 [Cucurbitaria berberidis CBS 394.84]
MFHRRGTNPPENLPTVTTPERTFMAGTRSSLAKRLKNSASLSMVYLPTMTEVKSESGDTPKPATKIDQVSATEPPIKNTDPQAALSPLTAMSSSPAQVPTPVFHHDSATVLTNMVNRVASMPPDAPDRERCLEIAEVCKTLHFRSIMLDELVLTVAIKQAVCHSVQCYRAAQSSAEKAREHARDAELNAERVSSDMLHLQRLCERGFHGKALQAIQQSFNGAKLVDGEDEATKAGTSKK